MARLRPLRDDELPAFLADSERRYAEDLVAQAGLRAEHARVKARRDHAELFPGGAPADGQAVYAVEDERGTRVGELWVAERDIHGRRSLWIYGVHVNPSCRGRGYGRAAMLLAEEEARSRGIDRIDLNVLGGNGPARRLYRSLGYEELSVWMGKDLA